MKIHVLFMCSGEYEEHYEEIIRAFPTEELAKDYSTKLETWLAELKKVEPYNWGDVDFDDEQAVIKATAEELAKWEWALTKLDIPEWEWVRLRYRARRSDDIWYRIKEVEYEVAAQC